MSNVFTIDKPLTGHFHTKLEKEDATFLAQVTRWGSKPLQTFLPKYAKFSSFKGRGYCVKEFFHTIVREPYRAGKNGLLVLERVVNFVREFFQTLFREPSYTWSDVGQNAKNILNATAALPARALTYLLDLVKLATGVLIPRAAIHRIVQRDENGEIIIDVN